MAPPANFVIAESISSVIKKYFPEKYFSLCHVHAIVGANVISVARQRNYRPVAGLAVIDCGDGVSIKLTDNTAFANQIGGAFHCWIESTDDPPTQRELVDLTFRHNRHYAVKNNIRWRKKNAPDFLWGLRESIVVKAELDAIPASFGAHQIWLSETSEGADWLTRHLAENMSAYVALTAEALRYLNKRAAKGLGLASQPA